MYRIEQLIKEEALFYTIDEVDSIQIIDIYSLDQEVSDALSERIKSTENVVVNVKSRGLLDSESDNHLGEIFKIMKQADFDSYVKGTVPEFAILREENVSLKFDFVHSEKNPQLFKYRLRQTIAEYSKNKRVLNMFPGISDLTAAAIGGEATHVVEFSDFALKEQSDFTKNLNDVSDKVQQIEGDFESAMQALEQPYQRFELIIAELSVLERYFPEASTSFKENHKNTIRNMQHMQLEQNGILILVSDDLNFHLDSYIRPGADRLTKYLSGKEYGEQKQFHAYAFYK